MPKTALMGSPLAVIGTVFRHRRTLAKTGAAVGGVLMLPILFLVMLPGLVFGDLSENTGALTSNTVISENIRASNQAIVEVLQESHDALLAKINAEIARLPEGDTASISDPYASSIIVNANQLIAQFCASQDDYKNINISKLKSLIRENEDGLFSYDVTSETATVEVPAEEENAPPRKVTFTRHTYTVSYAGDAYFADHVFHLTDKQKKTADSYVENLTMFFGGSASGLAMAVGVSDEVLAYRATIQQVAQKYGMEAYVELLMAVMMQESGGRGLDPMQAAEGSFNTRYPHEPNGIQDPEYSIECGVQELKAALISAEVENPIDMEHIKLALQGYNFGNGYISWAKTNYGGYSYANAVEFSTMQAARLGWDSYGDTQYPAHVLLYYPYGRAFTSGGNQAIVEVALTQLGNEGGQPYWSWYGFEGRVEWCACFVSWCYNQAGKSEPRFAGCEWQGVPWFQSHGQWGARGYENIAPGDAIFFDWDLDGSADHVGIVVGTDGSRVYTVEGNSGDACKIKSYDLNYQSIKGYGLMNW